MTSAARPTFLPAIGGHSLRDTGAGPVTYKSAKDLTAHTKLKFRNDEQKQELDREELKRKLLQKEKEFMEKATAKGLSENLSLEMPTGHELDQDDYSSDEESSEDEQDTAELMRELDKIKMERLAEQQRIKEAQEAEEEEEKRSRAITGNPLMHEELQVEFKVKRRWDDDVIFKNQSKDVDSHVPKKRFINDMLRSDFHRKFMDKYVK